MCHTLISGVPSALVLCVLEPSVTWASAFTSLFLSVERGRPVGVDVSLRSVRATDATGEGAMSPGEMGDMMGALTGRVFLSGVETMAVREFVWDRGERKRVCYTNVMDWKSIFTLTYCREC